MKKMLLPIIALSLNSAFVNADSTAPQASKTLLTGELNLKVYDCKASSLFSPNFKSTYTSENGKDKLPLYFLSKIRLEGSASGAITVDTKDTSLEADGSVKIGGEVVAQISAEDLANKSKEGCAKAKVERSPVTLIILPFAIKSDITLTFDVIKTHTFCKSYGVAGRLDGTWTNFDLHEIYKVGSSNQSKVLSVASTNYVYNQTCRDEKTIQAGHDATTKAIVNGLYHAPALLFATAKGAIVNAAGGNMTAEEAASEAHRIENFVTNPDAQIAALVELRRKAQNLPLTVVEAGMK